MNMALQRRRIRHRRFAIQALLLMGVAALVAGAVISARTNLSALGMTSGFGFLERATGWSYSFSLIERNIDDTYARTISIGIMNTAMLGAICIVLATILGVAVGTARDARNIGLKLAASVYVQIFRNIPLILQLLAWYAMLIHMPGPRQAMSFLDAVFLSNRGVMIPSLNISPTALVLVLGVALILPRLLRRATRWSSGQLLLGWALGTLLMLVGAALVSGSSGDGLLSLPSLKGLRFVGGTKISIELVAMIVAITLYGAAYIAEVVRGGLQEVPKGLVEAGKALGLSPKDIWMHIKMPMALRSIIPPLGNQWIFIMKATTLGVAIGFSDLFYIVSTSITQSGQTLELIAILMGVFLGINYLLAQLVHLLNARLQLKGH